MYHSMDEDYESQGVFLDIVKSFDKVWHGISLNLLNILEDSLRNRKQRVVLNGQASNWENIHAVVPPSSILVPLLLLVYINDLAKNLLGNPRLFVDDTSIFSVVRDLNASLNEITDDFKKIEAWVHQLKVSLILVPWSKYKKFYFHTTETSPIILI